MLLPIVALIFLTAFCIFLAVYLGVVEKQDSPKAELRKRLQRMARSGASGIPEELRSEIVREATPADQLFARLPLTRNLDQKLDRAGLKINVSLFVMIVAGLATVCAALVGLRTGSVLFGLLAAATCVLIAKVFLAVRAVQRVDKFTEQFPDALTMIARSLRAGHSFTTAVQLVGQEVPSPVGELFKTAYDQQLLGLRITDGLTNLNERIDSLDLRFFTTVVCINAETGGNLSEVLDKLSMTIRERLRIRRQVRVYTAQGRLSGYVLGALPIIAFIAFNLLNPEYESALIKEPMGIYVLVFAACMQLVGLLVIRNIIKIKI
ncbi:MAG: pilus assembly protein [Geobacteraceae bacterium GWC2_58_44]|nr:MAG: pilus assembly protein [Geobacteraceae bacterium GWC2_58_44]HBG07420.1 pilus assembly protein [Geobacter sp.]